MFSYQGHDDLDVNNFPILKYFAPTKYKIWSMGKPDHLDTGLYCRAQDCPATIVYLVQANNTKCYS